MPAETGLGWRKYLDETAARSDSLCIEASVTQSATKVEQRANRRFTLRLPVVIRYTDGSSEEFSAETRNVSAQGVLFDLPLRLAEGTRIEFTMTLPPEVTMTDSIRVRCQGKVVRVDETGLGPQVAVAAVIEQYDFIADPASVGMAFPSRLL